MTTTTTDTKRATTTRLTTTSEGRIAVRHRLRVVNVLTVVVWLVAAIVGAALDLGAWWEALVAAGICAVVCMMAANRMGTQIVNKPNLALAMWLKTAMLHFTTVVGVGLLLTLGFEFNPPVALLAALAVTLIHVFGDAWIVGGLTTSVNDAPDKQDTAVALAGETGTLGARA